MNLSTSVKSTRLLRLVIFLFTITICTNCRPVDQSTSNTKFNVTNRDAKNFALVVGSPNDLRGVVRDVSNVTNWLSQANLGYQVESISYASKAQILSKISEIAPQLSEQSTVFFYYSGHGNQFGRLITQGMMELTLNEVASGFANALNGRKFSRFIAVIDACHSGQNVFGNEALFLNQSQGMFSNEDFIAGLASSLQSGLFSPIPAQQTGSKSAPPGPPPFEQGLVIAAAGPAEISKDLGPYVGGAFTASLLTVIQNNPQATFQEILEKTVSLTHQVSKGVHRPVWKAMPESILMERFNNPNNYDESSNQQNESVDNRRNSEPSFDNQTPNQGRPSSNHSHSQSHGGTVIQAGGPIEQQGPSSDRQSGRRNSGQGLSPGIR